MLEEKVSIKVLNIDRKYMWLNLYCSNIIFAMTISISLNNDISSNKKILFYINAYV